MNTTNNHTGKTKSSLQEKKRKEHKQAERHANELPDTSMENKTTNKVGGYVRPTLHCASTQDCPCCSHLNSVGGFELPSVNMILFSDGGIQLAVTRAYLPKIEDYSDLENQLGDLTDWFDDHNSVYFAVGVECKDNRSRYYFVLGFGDKFVIGHDLRLRGDRIALIETSTYDDVLLDDNDGSPRRELTLVSKDELFTIRLGELAVAYISMICAHWHLQYKLNEDARITLRKMTRGSLALCQDFKKGEIYFDVGSKWATDSQVSGSWDSADVAESRPLMRLLAKLVNGTKSVPKQ